MGMLTCPGSSNARMHARTLWDVEKWGVSIPVSKQKQQQYMPDAEEKGIKRASREDRPARRSRSSMQTTAAMAHMSPNPALSPRQPENPSTPARTAHTSTPRQHCSPNPNLPIIEETHHAQPQHHTAPKQHIVQQRPAPDPLGALHHDDGHLQHHGAEAVAAELAGDAAHDELVGEGAD